MTQTTEDTTTDAEACTSGGSSGSPSGQAEPVSGSQETFISKSKDSLSPPVAATASQLSAEHLELSLQKSESSSVVQKKAQHNRNSTICLLHGMLKRKMKICYMKSLNFLKSKIPEVYHNYLEVSAHQCLPVLHTHAAFKNMVFSNSI